MSKKLIFLCSFVLVLVLVSTDLTLGGTVWEGRINKDSDDSEELDPSGAPEGSSSDLEIPYEDAGMGDKQLVGIRWEGVDVPKGARILDAWVEFEVDETGEGTTQVSVIIEGELNPNPPTFNVNATSEIANRKPRTTAQAIWEPEPWNAVGEKHKTSNIAVVIEEIVSQDGWARSNALVLIIRDNPANPSKGKRVAASYSGSPTGAAFLHIEYVTSATRATQPSPADGAIDVPRDVALIWKQGESAKTHDVYLGTVFNDVNDASRTNPRGVLVSQNLSTNSYSPAAVLQWEQTYYWRIDEVNGPTDFTIFKGGVWQFTVEPFTYPIAGANITASASSQFNADTGPQNTINGSGLDDNDLHSIEEADIWLSSLTGPQPTWIQYAFDKVYKLHQMWVWNNNTAIEPILGFGFKDVAIEYSTDGANWTTLGTAHEFARASGAAGYAHNTTVDLAGVPAKYVKLTANSNWGGLMPQFGLSEVRFFYVPVVAREPNPASGATDMDVEAFLTWRAGREAAKHNLYLSDSNQAVIGETISPVSIPADRSYTNYATGPLDLGKTYYWKVNEVNEAKIPATWQGDVWNFGTQEYLVVDSFEDYNDFEPDRVFDTWIDGWANTANGSQVGYAAPPFAEQTIIHSGKQSMPFAYDNTAGATYSEAECTFAVPQNWTEHGVKTLSLWFCGAVSNVAGQLYVKVNGSKVTYDGDAGGLTQGGWQPWNITLSAFGGLGVSLQRVTKLIIGIDGNGAKGTLYIDDIRLYPYERQLITAVEPDKARLVGHWKFDGDARDSSGLNNHGTIGGNPTFVAGKVGTNALNLDGSDYVAIDGVVNDITSTNLTISIWVKTTQTSEGEVIACNDSVSSHPLLIGLQSGSPYVNDGSDKRFPPAINDGQWHLLTYVRDGSTGSLYVDGLLRGTYASSFSLASVTRWSIGQEWDNTTPSDFYNGAVDDARVYKYALSYGEVGWLSGRTKPFDKPF